MYINPENLNEIVTELERRQENSNTLLDDGSVSELDMDLSWQLALVKEFSE